MLSHCFKIFLSCLIVISPLSASCCKRPEQGPPGPAGPTGATGPSGDAATGPTGATGATGATGPDFSNFVYAVSSQNVTFGQAPVVNPPYGVLTWGITYYAFDWTPTNLYVPLGEYEGYTASTTGFYYMSTRLQFLCINPTVGAATVNVRVLLNGSVLFGGYASFVQSFTNGDRLPINLDLIFAANAGDYLSVEWFTDQPASIALAPAPDNTPPPGIATTNTISLFRIN